MKFQNVGLEHTVSSETTAPPHTPQISDAGPSEVLTLVKETVSNVSDSNEKKASEDEDVQDEDLVNFDEVVLATVF